MTPASWTSLELLNACLDTSSRPAWAEFVRRYQPVIAGVIGRIASRYRSSQDAALIDDLVQETYIRLCRDGCRLLRQFQPESEESFFGYAKVVASSVALDHFRAQGAEKRGPQAVTLDEAAERHTDHLHQLHQSTDSFETRLIRDDLWRHIERVADQQRDVVILRLHFQQGFTCREISRMPWIQLSEKGVESCLARLVVRLREELSGNQQELKGKARPTAF